jgi:hypothetical protein
VSLRSFLEAVRIQTNTIRSEKVINLLHLSDESIPPYMFSQELQLEAATEFVASLSLKGNGVDAKAPLSRLIRAAASNSPTSKQPRFAFQLYVGGPLSGAPFHSHSFAFNVLISGRKSWLILPPGRDLYSNLHPIKFAKLGMKNCCFSHFLPLPRYSNLLKNDFAVLV